MTYTADQLTQAVALAIEARDWPAVVALLRALAAVDPHQAQALLDVVALAKVLRA
jgi:MoxR-like ATPase